MKRLTYLFTFLLALSFLFMENAYADGSKDLYPNGVSGARAGLRSSDQSPAQYPFPNWGTHYVYAEAGETITLASSAATSGNTPDIRLYGLDNSQINLVPYYTPGDGRIVTRANELAGPATPGMTPTGNQYKAIEYPVTQTGIYRIEFRPRNTGGGDTNPGNNVMANASGDLFNSNNRLIAAWDASVFNTAGTIVRGRVWANILNMSVGSPYDAGFYGVVKVLTNDGYIYNVDNNGNNGIYFAFFANNKGIINPMTKEATYQSLDASSGSGFTGRVHNPNSADSDNDNLITHKLFYTTPDPNMPATANGAVPGGTTWLKTMPQSPTVNSVGVFGVDGTHAQVGNKGGHIRFTANVQSSYTVSIESTEPSTSPLWFPTRTFTGTAAAGTNNIFWDGRDGDGDALSHGDVPAKVIVQLQGGEVHFPYIDTEYNVNGVIIELTNGPGGVTDPNRFDVYWDDTPLSDRNNGSNTSPKVNSHLANPPSVGIDSRVNGHKWGAGGSGSSNQYGDNRTIDTWGFIRSQAVETTTTVAVKIADLQVTEVTPDKTTLNSGGELTYTVKVRNNGPSDVEGAPFTFTVPSGFDPDGFTPSFEGDGCGTTTAITWNAADGTFTSTLDLPNGCEVTFAFTGNVTTNNPAGNTLTAEATILRPNDVTDPNATNRSNPANPLGDVDDPDNLDIDNEYVPPFDAHYECTNRDAGVTAPCNNILRNNVVFVNGGTPELKLEKVGTYIDTNNDGVVNVGDHIRYDFTVTNVGDVEVGSLVINDTDINVTNLAVDPATLQPTEVGTVTYTYAIQSSDIEAAGVWNLAIVRGETPGGAEVTDESEDPEPLDPGDPGYSVECPDCTYTPLEAPGIAVLKDGEWVDVNGDGVANAGDRIDYTFTVRNTGNVTLTNVTVTDDNATVSGGPLASLAVGAEDATTFTAVHVITQPDVDAGYVYNLALATGTTPGGGTVTDESEDPTECADCTPDPNCPDCTIVPLPESPGLEILKDGEWVDVNGDGAANAGDRIDYTFTVRNTGNVTLTNVTVTDDNATVSGGPLASLAVGAEDATTFTAVHVITQPDVDAGYVYNLALATGTTPGGGTVTDESEDPTECTDCTPDPNCPDCTIVPLPENPGLEILKDGEWVDVNGDGVANAGDRIDYTFTVRNTGNVTLTNVTVTDDNATVSGGPLASLAVGAEDATTFTAVHAVTQADMDAGAVYNLALATGTTPGGGTVTDESEDPTECTDCTPDPNCPDCTIVPLPENPGLEILKDGEWVDVNGDGVANAGDRIDYTFTVRNTGNVTLTNVTVTDDNATVSGGPLASLAVGAEDATTFTAVHAVTQADVDAGYVYNLALATGTTPGGGTVTDESEDPTECTDCTPDPNCPDCTIVPLPENPGLEILKDGEWVDVNGDGVANAGDRIDYTFTVRNTGNVTLTNVTVTDDNATVSGGPLASLAVGAEDATTFTAVHAVTQADVDAGAVYNLALATGTTPGGGTVTDESEDPTECTDCTPDPNCPDCTIVPLPESPGLEILKDGEWVDVNGDGAANAGDRIDYTFTVRNTGNVTLTNVTVTDDNATVSGGPISLVPGAVDTDSFTAVHAITQPDVDAGAVYNLALATGTTPGGGTVTDESEDPTECTDCTPDPNCPDCTIVPLPENPGLEILKDGEWVDANNDGVANAGDRIDYTFTVRNTGNVTLTNIRVTDDNAVVSGGPLATLAVGAEDATTFTAVHAITQADVDAGAVYNLALATGTTPGGGTVTDESEDPTPCSDCTPDPNCPDCPTTIVPLPENPGLEILKDGEWVDVNGDGVANAGDRIDYTFTVRNTGNVTLTNVTVTDDNATVSGGPLASLAVGAEDATTFTAVHAVTQPDVDAGAVYNLALATGTTPGGGTVTDESEDPTECTDCTPDPNCPDCTIVPLPENPGLEILKDGEWVDVNGDGVANAGDRIDYTFTVRNTGNVTLTNVTVTDDNATVSGGPLASLAVGAEDATTFTAVHAVTQPDVDAGYVYNLALATGTTPGGGTVTDESEDPTECTDCTPDPNCPDCTIVPLPENPGLEILKDGEWVDVNGDGAANAGDRIDYTFTVRNTGNVTLTNVTVTDDNATVSGGPLASLAVGAEDATTFTAVHVITQPDVDAGYVYNLALATGTTPGGGTVTDESEDPTECTDCTPDPNCPDCTIVPLPENPGLEILKDGEWVDVNGDGVANAGDRIDYTFTVRNTGNVTLTNVTVTDDNATVSGGPLASLAVGAEDATTFTAVHAVTQPDVDAGYVYNLALATGTTPGGGTVTDESEDPTECTDCTPDPNCPDCTIVPLPENPGLEVLKDGEWVDVNGDGKHNAGDRIDYTFTVRNTGNVTLTNVTVTDDNATVSGGPLASLAVGAEDATTFTAVHAVTQPDVDAGYVYNLALATGTTPGGGTVTDESEDPTECTDCTPDPNCPDCTIVPLPENPGLEVLKDGEWVDVNGDGKHNAGDEVHYTFTVRNTGNVTLTGITVTDDNATVSGGPISLAPNATDTDSFTAVHEITQADMDAGTVYNIALAEGTTPGGSTVTDESEDPTPCADCTPDPNCPDCPTTIVPLEQNGEIEVIKTAVLIDPPYRYAGDVIEYDIVVRNVGNVTLTNIVVTDDNADDTNVGTIAVLPVGGSQMFKAYHTITQEDMQRGYVANIALATGKDPNDRDVTDESETGNTPDPEDPTDPTCPDCTITPLPWKDIDAVDDNEDTRTEEPYAGINGYKGGTLPPVLLNDKVNNGTVNPSEVTVTPGTSPLPGKITMNPDGTVIVSPQTPAGTYRYPYTICEVRNSENCDDAVATIVVTAALIKAIEDEPAPINGTNGGKTPSVLDNDELDGEKVNPEEVNLTWLDDAPEGLTLNDDGTVTVAPETRAGTYVIEYRICEVLNPTNCSVTTTTIVVEPAPIEPVNDNYTVEWSRDLIVTGSVLDNDKFNNGPIDLNKVTLRPGAPGNPGLTMNPDGTITIAPSTRPGTYTYPYTICEVLNPNNCKDAVATIVIEASKLFIPNVFTPNGDGDNDTFEIVGIENFDRINLLVINRWGNEVYRNDSYDNSWNGHGLNSGTYYYIITTHKGGRTEVIKGWVMIKDN